MAQLRFCQKALQDVSGFIKLYLPLANAHMTDFIVKDWWHQLLPENIREELLLMDENQLTLLPSGRLHPTHHDVKYDSSDLSQKHLVICGDPAEVIAGRQIPKWDDSIKVTWEHNSLEDFIVACQQRTLPNIGVLTDLADILNDSGVIISINEFMSAKKQHEVETMTEICAALAIKHHLNVLVDIGSGKGYLSSHLCLQHGLLVLGIDSSPVNTEGATGRAQRLGKQWNGLVKRSKKKQEGVEADKVDRAECTDDNMSPPVATGSQLGKFVAITQYVDKQTDIQQLLRTHLMPASGQCTTESTSSGVVPAPGHDFHNRTRAGSSSCLYSNSDDSQHQKLGREDQCYGDQGLVQSHNESRDTGPDSALYGTARGRDQFPETENNCKQPKSVPDKTNDSEVELNPVSGHCEVTSPSLALSDSTGRGFIQSNVSNTQSELSGLGSRDFCVPVGDMDRESSLTTLVEYMLGGLHACGDLTPSTLRLYIDKPEARVLCNVGCCYHHLTETFLTSPYTTPGNLDLEPKGFPLSDFLLKRGCQLGRNARMLASQTPDRIADKGKSPSVSLYWRALLQVILRDLTGELRDDWLVGRIAAKCSNFNQYVHKALKKLDINHELSEGDIEQYERMYGYQQRFIQCFVQFKAALAPCIETLIILDRACYLLEQETVRDVYVVQAFNPVISPRCYAILAAKV